jgi:NCS2 family nucleobase:cation symporter-2
MIGLSGGIAGLRSLLGVNATPVTPAEWWVGAATLAIMAALNVWGTGIVRMLCALIGLVIGYLAASFAGLLDNSMLLVIRDASWVGIPSIGHVSWSFDVALAAPFAIACVAAAMKAAGTITVCQRMNDADWVRPDMNSTTRGVLADGVSTALAGLAGAVGTNTSTPAVGLAAATGVASRNVAYAVAAIFMLLTFFPKVTALLAVMPRALVVSALLFAVTFIIMNGVQVINSRLLDARRTLVLGLSIVAGVAVEVFPGVATAAPKQIGPLIGSSLVFSTTIALALNLLFRLGVKKTARLTLKDPQFESQKIDDFLQSQCATWGARPDVAKRATFGAIQLVEAVAENCWHHGPLVLEASFDEFNLDVRVSYEGPALEFPDRRPSIEQIRDSEDSARLLAGFMLRRNADRVRSDSKDGRAVVHFHFDH